MKQSVAAILISSNNEFILQHRDNKTTIAEPNKIVNFGGRVETDEIPTGALIREIKEELSIQLEISDLDFFRHYETINSKDGKPRRVHAFIVRNIPIETLTLKEGAAIVSIDMNDPLESPELWEMTRVILNDYKKSIGH